MQEQEFLFFCDLVKKKAGIHLTKGKEYLVSTRLEDVSKSLGCPNFTDFYRRVKFNSTPEIIEKIIEAITTPETCFFRDTSPFDALKTHILPEIVERKKTIKSLRIWSAASSTGQEAYSIAMTIQDMKEMFNGWYIHIMSTDISDKVLKIARSGKYTQFEISRGMPITLLSKYFKDNGNGWSVDEKIKRMVEFRKFNLFDPYINFGMFDLIFCRNVLIYFETSDKKSILERMAKNLNRNGYLILGSTETIFGITDKYTKQSFGRFACYKVC
ncbi:MAG: CheR family methyltransferase [Candidatus Anammoxibacter sp.]